MKSALFTLSALSPVFAGFLSGSDASLAVRAANESSATVEMVAAAWFAGWHAVDGVVPKFAVGNVSWDKYTSVVYSFAITTNDDAHFSLAPADQKLLPDFVKEAHANNVEARLAVGGWGGSQYFSPAFASEANRTASIKTLVDMVKQYNLDGIDFDWEYEGRQGIGCNIVNPQDSANFLSLLQELRKDPTGAKLTLSSAVVTPFADTNGDPMTDVSAYASLLDYVEIMNYDIHGNWSTGLGPNAPLNDSCVTDPSQAQGSAVTLVDQWVKAGFPHHQIVLGMASYGHTFDVKASEILSDQSLTQYPAFNAGKSQGAKFGDSWTNVASTDQCGALIPAGGDMDFWGLIDGGFLESNGTQAQNGIIHAFDDCSQTDYVYNPQTQVAVSYDSPRAFAAKGSFIKSTNLRGFSIWEAGGDRDDILLDSVRTAAGFEDDCTDED